MRFLAVLVALALVFAATWLAYGHYAEQGLHLRPMAAGSFADAAWRGRWAVREGDFAVQDQRWVGTGALANIAVLREQTAGATAIEFGGEVLRGSIACDLSALWYEDVSFSPDGARATTGTPALKFQIGAYDNSFSGIIGRDGALLATSPFTLETGRRYHVRAEIIDDTLRLLVDGNVLCEYRSPLPAAAGHWAIYSFYPGKAFAAVTVSGQAFTPQVPASAVADRLAAHGLFAQAGREYVRIADDLGDAPPAAMAWLRGALCLEKADQLSEADAAWKRVAQGPYAGHDRLNTLERRARNGEPLPSLLTKLTLIHGTGDAAFASQCARTWERWLGRLRAGPHTVADIDAFLAAWRAWAHNERLVERSVVECLLMLRREEDILATFTNHRALTATVMMHMGRGEEALGHCPDHSADRARALLALGRYDEAIPHAPGWMVPWILVEAGRHDEVIRDWSGHRAAVAESLQRQGRNAELLVSFSDANPTATSRALAALDRGDEALALPDLPQVLRREILIRLDRLDEAAILTTADPVQEQTLDACRAWGALGNMDLDAARVLLQPRCRWIFDLPDQGRLRWLVGPCALALAGPRDDLEATLTTARATVGGAYRGELGRQIDAVLGHLAAGDPDLAHPTRSWLLVAGLRSDLANDAPTARAHYVAYLRDNADADPALTRFVAWRLTVR